MKADKLIKVVYEHVAIPAEELQQRLDDAFDLLFDETMKTFETDEGTKQQPSNNILGAFAITKN